RPHRLARFGRSDGQDRARRLFDPLSRDLKRHTSARFETPFQTFRVAPSVMIPMCRRAKLGRAKDDRMTEFRLTQTSDTHLARWLPNLTQNFARVSEYIDATR